MSDDFCWVRSFPFYFLPSLPPLPLPVFRPSVSRPFLFPPLSSVTRLRVWQLLSFQTGSSGALSPIDVCCILGYSKMLLVKAVFCAITTHYCISALPKTQAFRLGNLQNGGRSSWLLTASHSHNIPHGWSIPETPAESAPSHSRTKVTAWLTLKVVMPSR